MEEMWEEVRYSTLKKILDCALAFTNFVHESRFSVFKDSLYASRTGGWVLTLVDDFVYARRLVTILHIDCCLLLYLAVGYMSASSSSLRVYTVVPMYILPRVTVIQKSLTCE